MRVRSGADLLTKKGKRGGLKPDEQNALFLFVVLAAVFCSIFTVVQLQMQDLSVANEVFEKRIAELEL